MSVLHPFKLQLPPFKVGRSKQLISTDALSIKEKQDLWKGIKKTEPELAELLKNDPTVDLIKREFNATIQFYADDVNKFIKTGQQK